MDKIKLFILNILMFIIGISFLGYKHYLNQQEVPAPIIKEQVEPVVPVQPKPSKPNPDISIKIPDYLNDKEMVDQLKKWNSEAPKLTSIGTYGKSSRGKELWYIRIHGDDGDDNDPVVLTTACIHGNEPWASSTVMAYIGTMLDAYGEDEQITKLIDTRDFYFIPIVSPDSYPNSRYVDRVDPNRNFPTLTDADKQSVPPVQALRDFFLKIKPNAVISGHTWGRVYLIPYGDQMMNCPNHDDYKVIMDKMAEMSRYRWMRAYDMYEANGELNNPPIKTLNNMLPIYGTEIDWYYRNGAAGIVMEFGTHQRIPSVSDIQTEFARTYKAVLYYYETAPLMKIKN